MEAVTKKIFVALLLLAGMLASAAAAGAEIGDKIRIGILPFDNKAKGVNVEQADIITDVFTR
ncbi:MAG: hypothetical protein LBO82_08795, partial [Synergistaceae bacterium]|nr:hypothetical protein [Synergistaceae bacterium]